MGHERCGTTVGAGLLAEQLTRCEAVLYDFDGPVTRLFHGYPTLVAAKEVKEIVRAWLGGPLPAVMEESEDPHGVLLQVRSLRLGVGLLEKHPDSFLRRLDAVIEAHELIAARTAEPTPGFADLFAGLAEKSVRQAIVTNNAPKAVLQYLVRQWLLGGVHSIHGRLPNEPLLMKPHPRSLLSALSSLDLPAEACLFIGDQPSDLAAAGAAGVPFVGFAHNDAKFLRLRNAGADVIVRSMGEISDVLRLARRPGQPVRADAVHRRR
ncbi:HAD family hydrolase [Streptomyces coryli]|nr:HAD family hydrolase [Streptomyces coryli]